MKTILLLSLLSVAAFAQRVETSVCVKDATDAKPAVLTVCNFATGMSGLPRLRLYLRVYADGTAAYEENDGIDKLVLHKLKVSAEQLAEIKRLGETQDFQSARADYPVFRRWTDSGLETTIIFRGRDGEKKTLVRNYRVSDKIGDDDKNYSASLVALLRLADGVRNPKPATPKTPVPQILAYNRILKVGKTYRGRVNFGSAYGMTLTPFPKLPYHHSVMYSWVNVDKFPELDPDKNFGVRTIVFKVLDKEVENIGKNRWTTTFTIEILRVE
jgi:hypothetical protein